MERGKRILVAPLDWGLGHGTRCVPLIKGLLQRGCQVVIAGSGASLRLLQNEFAGLKTYTLPGYAPVYPANGNMVGKMAGQLPHFISVINAEHRQLAHIVQQEKIEVVIADNRYGCYAKGAHNIFITHQLHILMPPAFKWMEGAVNFFNHRQMKRFAECWVPAMPANFLPELLPEVEGIKVRYIGYLSALQKVDSAKKYEIMAVGSGPEPQKSIFTSLLAQQLAGSGLPAVLVKGTQQGTNTSHGQLTELAFCNGNEMSRLMAESELVIARSGYSTVMDLMKLGKKAIFIPTPGQTEQEYLAQELMKRKIALAVPQQGFNLAKALKQASKYRGFGAGDWSDELLNKALDSIV